MNFQVSMMLLLRQWAHHTMTCRTCEAFDEGENVSIDDLAPVTQRTCGIGMAILLNMLTLLQKKITEGGFYDN